MSRYCVIMCGGIGSRFWPFSRTDRPKQFLDFFGAGRSLLQMSYDRVLPLVHPERIFIITNAQYLPLIREQLPDVPNQNILAEPARRNTAPAIAWASYHIHALDPDASIMVAPSDHLILREEAFVDSVRRGFEFVENNDALLTLGIEPSRPETGYGYIQIGQQVSDHINAVKTFTEKPDIELAKVILSTGEFFWNSGIFIWSAKSIIDALHQTAPDLATIFDRANGLYGTDEERRWIDKHFESCPAISIDYAVMERASNVYVETVSFGWSDLGTWGSLYDLSPKNPDRNVTQQCKVLSYGSSGNIFAVKGDKLVVVAGLKDYIVADTDNVLLIYPKSDEQKLRQTVNDVKMNYGDTYL